MELLKNDAYIALKSENSNGVCRYPICDFTPEFLQWQLEDRMAIFEDIAAKDIVPSFASHLPVVTTVNRNEALFPFHTSTKGVGLLPKDEYLQQYCDTFSQLIDVSNGNGRKETKRQRVEAIRKFYNSEHIASNKLGLLEIFRGNSFRNIEANPLVSLQFTSAGPHYKSFQINGIAEIVDSSDLNFQFIWLARRLFEYESFHIQHPEYITGYVVWVSEVYDKAPIRGRAGKRLR
ncbi:MAG: hypothetical protein ACE5HS_23330 [bacterium]